MQITIRFPESSGPVGKLADAELHFTDGPLTGLKLIGFGVWERRDHSRIVTLPTRQYSVNGERGSFALLRAITDTTAADELRSHILQAYADAEATEVLR